MREPQVETVRITRPGLRAECVGDWPLARARLQDTWPAARGASVNPPASTLRRTGDRPPSPCMMSAAQVATGLVPLGGAGWCEPAVFAHPVGCQLGVEERLELLGTYQRAVRHARKPAGRGRPRPTAPVPPEFAVEGSALLGGHATPRVKRPQACSETINGPLAEPNVPKTPLACPNFALFVGVTELHTGWERIDSELEGRCLQNAVAGGKWCNTANSSAPAGTGG